MAGRSWRRCWRQAAGPAVAAVTCGALAAAEPPTALPERPLFRQFSSAQGLPSNSVVKLARDRSGRLWLATRDGLARYDGHEMRIWRHDPDDPASLPGNDVQHVLVDAEDRVWIAVQDAGVARYDPDRDGFEQWRHRPGDPASLPGDRIWTLAEDGSGGVWLGGFNTGLARLRGNGRISRWRHDPADPASLCSDIILSLASDGPDTLWIGGVGGLCRWRGRDGFAPMPLDSRDPGPAPVVIGIEVDGPRLWLATDRGLRVVGAAPEAVLPTLPAELERAPGWATLIEPDGGLWYGSLDGIRRWPGPGQEVLVYPARPGWALALQAPVFLDVLRDSDGSLWFASDGGGLAQLQPRWRAVRVYRADPGQDGAPLPDRVRQLQVDGDGRLLVVGLDGAGVVELDPGTGRTRLLAPTLDDEHEADRYPVSALRDSRRQLWLGHRGRIGRLAPGNGDWHYWRHDRDQRPLPSTPVRRMAETADGTVLAAFGGGGLAWFDRTDERPGFAPLGREQGLPCAEISDMRSSGGWTWLACERGLLRIADGSNEVLAVAGVPAVAIDGLAFAPDGSAWLHAMGQLLQFRAEADRLHETRRVDGSLGWPAVKAGGVLVDADGVVWVTSPRGLYSYEPASGRISHYDQDDGLPSAEFCDSPPAALAPFRIAAGTASGPVVIDTRMLRAALPPARLHWRSTTVLRNGTETALAMATPWPVRLRHDDRELRLAARLDSLAKPAAHRYRFLLHGYDDDWYELEGSAERIVERLPSGRFRLQVQAIGSDGQPAANALEQWLEVTVPPWRSPWAGLAYLVAALLLAWLLQQGLRRRLHRQHALTLAEERRLWAEQGSEAKTRFLAVVGHELRTPMAGLLGMNALLLDSPLDPRQQHYARSVRQAGEHMLGMVNDLLDLSRIEAGKLQLQAAPLDLVAMADELLADVDAEAERKGLSLGLRIAVGTPLQVIGDGKRLRQILLNFLVNALKFTDRGRVRLVLEFSHGQHVFSVTDEGSGISPELRQRLFVRYSQDQRGARSGGSGLGLAIARELATLMAGEVGVDPVAPGPGSRFWLRVRLAPGQSTAPGYDTAALPPLCVLDRDPVRAADLVASLRAMSARAHCHGQGGPDSTEAALVLVAAASHGHALADLAEAGLAGLPRVVALPLDTTLPAAAEGERLLPGPWRLGDTLAACRSLLQRPRPAPADAHIPPRRDLNGIRLLVVEDDELLLEVLATRLAARGARVDCAGQGLDALVRLDADPGAYDALLLDLDLPGLDGLQLLELLHQPGRPPPPPTVVITARQQPGDEERCRGAGARAFFRKPVDPDRLSRCLLDLRGVGATAA